MLENILINRLNHTDLNMYQCGMEDCAPGHHYGPAIRDHYLIHYILKGKGFFQVGDTTYHLTEGYGFLICPDIITYYQADREDPWHYAWVGFHGLKAEAYLKHANLTADNPIFKYDKDDFIKDCFMQMIATKRFIKSRELRLLGLLYLFLSQLIEIAAKDRFLDAEGDRQELYIKKAIEFVEMNYSRKIRVHEIAHYIALDRSYLCSIFKEHLGISPQEFLINFRINKACELMKNKNLSIANISRSVGYDDPLLFSKMFKKVKGFPPREYRKAL
ncbi:MAG: AraC family transcriptional regulator [Clostridia bacterium]|jgi:AraC-like DNA-binding protein|uniref:AraC family transcriptional regulator n=1 Tax=Petroclostridium xylanilyticum TaxID=1792311 RepID=UPI000B9993BC|nr:AraC family transcriptional regulator [Petroclostridium xylanilyticum]MBZ4645307.1 AraC family transcriptional regulator [Clostridia bacterium]